MENQLTTKFQLSWQVGQSWLNHDNKIMWCDWCREHYEKIKVFVKKRQFIDGNTTMKKETIVSHEKSDAHDYAESIHFNTKVKPTSAPG